MANRRVSELNELLNTQVAANDLFLITDVSAVESKKIQASELRTFAMNGTASYALACLTASYALLARSASWAPPAISASYALSASYADLAKTASYILSASYALTSSWASMSFWATTASYALTSSVQLVISSGLANYADTASYLLWTAGRVNGTASYAMSASRAFYANSADYLNYAAGTVNGTASYAMTASLSRTASFLYYDGSTYNGSASYAVRSGTSRLADSASISDKTSHVRLFREFDIVTSSLIPDNTASFGWMNFSASNGTVKVSMEVWGDVKIPIHNYFASSGSLQLLMESVDGNLVVDNSTCRVWLTGSSTNQTGSIISPFILKGQFTVSPTPQRFSGSVLAYNGVTIWTGSRQVQAIIRATTDYFVDE